jgi:hypothetical protein
MSAVARARRKKTRNAAAPSGSTTPSGHGTSRFSAKTNDWTKAYAKVAELDTEPIVQTKDITVVDAVTRYLVKRSGREKDANKAPYRDCYILSPNVSQRGRGTAKIRRSADGGRLRSGNHRTKLPGGLVRRPRPEGSEFLFGQDTPLPELGGLLIFGLLVPPFQ